jgi:hypothetical protein
MITFANIVPDLLGIGGPRATPKSAIGRGMVVGKDPGSRFAPDLSGELAEIPLTVAPG